jgi:hypothetical protein
MIRSRWFALAGLAILIAGTGPAWGHFPWLVRNEDGSVQYFFGEGLADRTYKLPPAVAGAKVYAVLPEGKLKELDLKPIEQEGFIGLHGTPDLPADAMLVSQVTFGIYHGSRLNYYTMHVGGQLPTSRDAYKSRSSNMDLTAELVDAPHGVDLFVSWKGKPLSDIEVHLYCAEGHEEGTATTDADGKVSFTRAEVEEGLNGIMLGHTVDEEGKLKDASYDKASHYLTVTFNDNGQSAAKSQTTQAAYLPPLPFEITSFGAVRHGDALYVYGGHTGSAHSYSNTAQSNKLLKLNLAEGQGASWEELASGPRLQGLGMVAHRDRLILVGGFTAMNEEGQDHDLHSQSTVLAYDLKSQTWKDLPALPEARSSHDAALVGDTLYVVGGWKIAGDDTTWHTTAWSMDLSSTEPQWVEIAKPPFVRRAMATVAHRGKLFVLGGMNEKGGPTKSVAIYDPNADTWSEGAELLGEKPMAGFGAAGWSVEGALVVTTYEGDIQRWNEDAQQWELLGKTADARFFHRLLPLDGQHVVSLGGANMAEGKFLELEVIGAR